MWFSQILVRQKNPTKLVAVLRVQSSQNFNTFNNVNLEIFVRVLFHETLAKSLFHLLMGVKHAPVGNFDIANI